MLRRRTLFCLLVHTNNMEKVIFSNMPPQLIWLQFLKVLLSIPVPLMCPLILIRFRLALARPIGSLGCHFCVIREYRHISRIHFIFFYNLYVIINPYFIVFQKLFPFLMARGNSGFI